MSKIGFDNDKYLRLQSQKFLRGSHTLAESCIWNSAESCLMIIMLQSASRLQTGQQGENASRAEGAGRNRYRHKCR